MSLRLIMATRKDKDAGETAAVPGVTGETAAVPGVTNLPGTCFPAGMKIAR